MGSIKLLLIVFVISAAGGGYMYVSNLQKNLMIAQANAAKLETAVQLNEQTITSLREDYAKINQELTRINNEFAETRRQNNVLKDKLANVDLGMLAQTKPDSIERAINRGTVNAGRCFEILSGAPLTDQEKEATDGKSFNKECPWLWPGPVDLNQQ
jgi:septal ring factor EnvC (AmiA/AmiB activator)